MTFKVTLLFLKFNLYKNISKIPFTYSQHKVKKLTSKHHFTYVTLLYLILHS